MISQAKDYYKIVVDSSLVVLDIIGRQRTFILSINNLLQTIIVDMIVRNFNPHRYLNLISKKNIALYNNFRTQSICIKNARDFQLNQLTFVNYHNFSKITSKKQNQRKEKTKQKAKIKESIQDVSTIDLNKFQQNFENVLNSFKQQMDSIKAGRLDKSSFANIFIKVNQDSLSVVDLAQIAPQSLNSCIISPYDTQHLELIDKAIRVHQNSYQVTKKDRSIIVAQPATSLKQFKEKMVVKVKKMSNDFRDKLSKERHKSQEQLKKYKKVIPEERYKIAEKQLKQIFDKVSNELEKITKEKEKELSK